MKVNYEKYTMRQPDTDYSCAFSVISLMSEMQISEHPKIQQVRHKDFLICDIFIESAMLFGFINIVEIELMNEYPYKYYTYIYH